MSAGEQPPGDDELWRRLSQIPDSASDVPPDTRRFRVSAPETAPRQPSYGEHDRTPDPQVPVVDPQSWPAEEVESPRPQRTRPRRWPKVLLVTLGVLLVVAIGFAVWAWILWERIDRVDTAGALSPGGDGFTNYLIVGTDSRDGVDPDLESAPNIGLGVEGQRSDTMLVLHIGSGGNHMVSLPRDLWVTLDSGSANKLNAARQFDGVPGLIRTIRSDPGIPIHRYVEVDIAGFLGVIEAVGAITIDFPAPACDPKSGLDVRETGPVALGPEQALAYVRSRTYTEFDAAAAQGLSCQQVRSAGLGRVSGGSDIGRTERQRAFLLAVFDRAAGSRNPVTALSVLSGIGGALTVDDGMGLWDALGLFRDLRGLDATTHALPVSDLNVNGASALALRSDAQGVLDIFRGVATEVPDRG